MRFSLLSLTTLTLLACLAPRAQLRALAQAEAPTAAQTTGPAQPGTGQPGTATIADMIATAIPLPSLPADAVQPLDYTRFKLARTLDNGSAALALCFSPDGSTLAAAVERRVLRFDTTTWDAQKPLASFHATVSALAYSADGKFFAGGCEGTKAQLQFCEASGKLLHTIDVEKPVTCLAFSADDALLACALQNGDVAIFNCNDGTRRATLHGSAHPAFTLFFTADGQRLRAATGGANPGAEVIGRDQKGEFAWTYHSDSAYIEWSLSTGLLTRQLTIVNGGPNCALSADGKLIAYIGTGLQITEDKAARANNVTPSLWRGSVLGVWRTPLYHDDGGRIIAVAPRRKAPFVNAGRPSMAFSPDASVIAVGDSEGEYLWNYAAGTFMPLPDRPHGLQSTAFSTNGRLLAGSDPHSIFVWSID